MEDLLGLLDIKSYRVTVTPDNRNRLEKYANENGIKIGNPQIEGGNISYNLQISHLEAIELQELELIVKG